MKISVITVVYNAENYIKDCIESVVAQTYPAIEYIVVDGGSTDRTISIIGNYVQNIAHFVSEKDQGMYDALNKGMALATGDVIGILNADDMLAAPNVIEKIAQAFSRTQADAIYGNLNYVNVDPPYKIIRKWVSTPYTPRGIVMGWMPAHPTLYVKSEIFKKFGNYSLLYGTAADYELILRFLFKHRIRAMYLNELIVNMRVGGMSNANYKQRYRAFLNDLKAIKTNGIPFAYVTVILKKLRKLPQFFA
ncbi:MAG: glycosyltransferase family 2 protein [Pedobacter sp.]|nr:glycosyltransferase family 2 protein [Pedobacter sp.]MDQ8053966.1 glycosyltransferase family 2 protein [Pedobacter sp.]